MFALMLGGLEILLILAMGVLGTVFWIWMLIECATREPSTGNDKIVWVIVIALTHWIGALIYFFVRRPQRIAANGR
jgi:hypothetical protein